MALILRQDPPRLFVRDDAEGDGIVVGGGFEIAVAGRAEDAVLRPVGVEGLDEVTLGCLKERQAAPDELAATDEFLRFGGAAGELFELDQAVERGDRRDRESREVGFVIGPIGFEAAGIARGEEVRRRADEEEVVRGVAARVDEIRRSARASADSGRWRPRRG